MSNNHFPTSLPSVASPANFQELKDKVLFKLSSIGYALHCDVAFTNRCPGINQDINQLNQLKHGDSIYISPGETTLHYNELVRILHAKNIKVNFYLMDEPIIRGNIVRNLLPYAIDIFAMNNIHNHPNIHNMPIGIRDCGKVVPMHNGFYHDYLYKEGQQTAITKEYLCLLCFSFTHRDRVECYNLLKNREYIINLNDNPYPKQPSRHCGKVPIWTNYEYLHKSVYCLSPRGCGEATHRFFEAIYLDTIPIVKKTNTPFDKLYNVFPCLVVNDWNEITEDFLEQNKAKCVDKIAEFKTAYPNAFTDISSIHELLLQT